MNMKMGRDFSGKKRYQRFGFRIKFRLVIMFRIIPGIALILIIFFALGQRLTDQGGGGHTGHGRLVLVVIS